MNRRQFSQESRIDSARVWRAAISVEGKGPVVPAEEKRVDLIPQAKGKCGPPTPVEEKRAESIPPTKGKYIPPAMRRSKDGHPPPTPECSSCQVKRVVKTVRPLPITETPVPHEIDAEHETWLVECLSLHKACGTWKRTLEVTRRVMRGAPMKDQFDTICAETISSISAHKVTHPTLRMLLDLLLEEFNLDLKFWGERVYNKQPEKLTEIYYAARTLKIDSLMYMFGYIDAITMMPVPITISPKMVSPSSKTMPYGVV